MIDDSCRGILPNRMLLPLYPLDFDAEISAGELATLLQLLEKQAFNQLTDYLAKAEHSEQQCRNLLKGKQFDNALIEAVISRLIELNYLDNARYAEIAITSLINRKASKRAIIAKLKEQRISASIWEPLLGELYDQEQAADNLEALLSKYCATHRTQPYKKLKEKAFTYLYGKGFDLADIQIAWENLNNK